MIIHAQHSFSLNPFIPPRRPLTLTLPSSSRENLAANASSSRRSLLLFPSLSIATVGLLRSIAPAIAEENLSEPPPPSPPPTPPAVATPPIVEENKEEAVVSRVYDASVIGEPQALGKDKRKVWEKLLGARVVYLGEAELVPDKDDRELELEIVKSLRSRCLEKERGVSLALEAFPCNLQEQLDQFADGR